MVTDWINLELGDAVPRILHLCAKGISYPLLEPVGLVVSQGHA